MPTTSETTIVRVSNTSPLFGKVKPNASKSLNNPMARSEPQQQAADRRKNAHDQGLDDDRAEHLTPRCAEGAKGGELAGALRDRDRQRIGDDERADEQRDATEGEQERLQERDEAGRVLGVSSPPARCRCGPACPPARSSAT